MDQYIDLDYSGGGIGEYQFYNRHTKSWDSTSCKSKTGRCAKMDCHLASTNFKLLGFFKEPNYHEWMEQLFKHQGVCLWTDNEYSFMQSGRQVWPCYCTSTGQQDESGKYTLFYDTRPMPEGRIGLGLYTDEYCKQDYMGSKSVADVLSKIENDNNNNNGNEKDKKENSGNVASLAASLSTWNDAFDVYKVCQPCKAYNLGYNSNANGERQGGDADAGYTFDCYDDANYVNVNQCMKFKTKTEMLAADFRDIMLAHQQGTIVEFELMGSVYGYGGYRTNAGALTTEFKMASKGGTLATIYSSQRPALKTLLFFGGSILFLLVALVMFCRARVNRRRNATSDMNAPLVASPQAVAA
jgi:hypothetical protein